MEPGSVHGDFRIQKQGDFYGDRVHAFYCRECGFTELYKEPSTKETWRFNKRQASMKKETHQKEREEPASEKPSKQRLIR